MSANAVHIRIVYPERFRGTKHASRTAGVFITLPGQPEQPFPGVVNVKTSHHADDATRVKVELICSAEIDYEDTPS